MSKKDKLIVNKKHMFSNKDNKDKCNNKSNKDKCNYNKSKCKFKTKFNKEIKDREIWLITWFFSEKLD